MLFWEVLGHTNPCFGGDKVKGSCVLWTIQSHKKHLYTYHGDRRESLSTSVSAMSLGCELETTVYSDVPLLSTKSISLRKKWTSHHVKMGLSSNAAGNGSYTDASASSLGTEHTKISKNKLFMILTWCVLCHNSLWKCLRLIASCF